MSLVWLSPLRNFTYRAGLLLRMQDSSLQKTIGLEMLRPKMIRAVLGMKHLGTKGLLERMVVVQNVNRSYTSRYRSSQSEKVWMDDLGATIP